MWMSFMEKLKNIQNQKTLQVDQGIPHHTKKPSSQNKRINSRQNIIKEKCNRMDTRNIRPYTNYFESK